MDKADRNYVESLISRAQDLTRTARDVAASFGLFSAVEQMEWALTFQQRAMNGLTAADRNPDGTTGSARITSEGIELDPPKG